MTSAANRRRPSSGSEGRGLARLFTGLFTASILLTAAPAGAADHVVTVHADGLIDWTDRVVRVVGVGTPRILSPTGALTADDLYTTARADAAARVERVLGDVPVGGGKTLRQIGAFDGERTAAARAFQSAETRHFSDGTVHLPAEVALGFVGAGWPATEPSAPPAADGPTGVVIELSEPTLPALRVELRVAGANVAAGARGDRLGAAGVVWVHDRADAPAGFVGERPRVVAGKGLVGQAGVIELAADAAELVTGPTIAGGLLVVVPGDWVDPPSGEAEDGAGKGKTTGKGKSSGKGKGSGKSKASGKVKGSGKAKTTPRAKAPTKGKSTDGEGKK